VHEEIDAHAARRSPRSVLTRTHATRATKPSPSAVLVGAGDFTPPRLRPRARPSRHWRPFDCRIQPKFGGKLVPAWAPDLPSSRTEHGDVLDDLPLENFRKTSSPKYCACRPWRQCEAARPATVARGAIRDSARSAVFAGSLDSLRRRGTRSSRDDTRVSGRRRIGGSDQRLRPSCERWHRCLTFHGRRWTRISTSSAGSVGDRGACRHEQFVQGAGRPLAERGPTCTHSAARSEKPATQCRPVQGIALLMSSTLPLNAISPFCVGLAGRKQGSLRVFLPQFR